MSVLPFIYVFLFRAFNAFSIQTFFQPDEYFQALEPAHRLVYGYGYMTWEWNEALRSSLHPLLYACAYKVFNLVFSEPIAIYVAPKITGALIAAAGDIYVYKFARNYWQDSHLAKIALGLSLLSSWNWYISTRSFSNNLEMILTTAGLSYWPWHQYKLFPLLISCLFGFLSCIVRPTNAILWGFLAIIILVKNLRKFSRLASLLISVNIVLALVILVSLLADRLFYHRWTFPVYNFLEFNVMRNLSIFYGSDPWHFYLFQGLPVMLMGYVPAFVYAAITNRTSVLTSLVLVVVSAFSAIAHKEFRFLQPIYPVMLVLSAQSIYQKRHIKFGRIMVAMVLLTHLIVAYFFTRLNEVGEIKVIELLRDDPTVVSVGFLTPCHSTPWHSVLHRPDLVEHSWFLTCDPPLHLEMGSRDSIRAYRDQSDQFFDDPVNFLQNLPYFWPSHLVIFEPMEQVLKSELREYRECTRLFNSYFHWDSRRQGDIIIFCKDSSKVTT